MWKPAVYALLAVAVACQGADAQEKSVEQQIAEAVSPLPQPLQAGATVMGYGGGNELAVIREGTNMMVCLADNPQGERWHVACYHKDLEPFMARGRELRAQGMRQRAALDAARLAEIEAGSLKMPEQPTALYSLTGPEGSYDFTSGEVNGARGLYVVYIPYATEESVGYSVEPSRERPWLMFPGTPWAHIMISR